MLTSYRLPARGKLSFVFADAVDGTGSQGGHKGAAGEASKGAVLSMSEDARLQARTDTPHTRAPSSVERKPSLVAHLTSPHLTSPHLTPPHLTSPHLTPPHLTSPQHTAPWRGTSAHPSCLYHPLTPSPVQRARARHADARGQARIWTGEKHTNKFSKPSALKGGWKQLSFKLGSPVDRTELLRLVKRAALDTRCPPLPPCSLSSTSPRPHPSPPPPPSLPPSLFPALALALPLTSPSRSSSPPQSP